MPSESSPIVKNGFGASLPFSRMRIAPALLDDEQPRRASPGATTTQHRAREPVHDLAQRDLGRRRRRAPRRAAGLPGCAWSARSAGAAPGAGAVGAVVLRRRGDQRRAGTQGANTSRATSCHGRDRRVASVSAVPATAGSRRGAEPPRDRTAGGLPRPHRDRFCAAPAPVQVTHACVSPRSRTIATPVVRSSTSTRRTAKDLRALLRVLAERRRGDRGRPQGDHVRRVPGRPAASSTGSSCSARSRCRIACRAFASASAPLRSATRRSRDRALLRHVPAASTTRHWSSRAQPSRGSRRRCTAPCSPCRRGRRCASRRWRARR